MPKTSIPKELSESYKIIYDIAMEISEHDFYTFRILHSMNQEAICLPVQILEVSN